MKGGCVVFRDTGQTGQSGVLSLVAPSQFPSGATGLPRVTTYPTRARFEFGGGRMGYAHFSADIVVGIVDSKGNMTVSALDADIPAFLREGAMEAFGGPPDSKG